MEKIGFIFCEPSTRSQYFKNILEKEYEVLFFNCSKSTETEVKKSFDEIVALIVDSPSNNKKMNKLINCINEKNTYMFTLPVIIATDPENIAKDDKYLESPVAGIISTSDTEKIILNRIAGCIKFCNSTSFEEFSNILQVLPVLVYVKDERGRYAFCSQHWHHVMTEHKTIRGKTDFEIRKDKDNARIAQQSDIEVLKTGKGKKYIIKENDKEEGIDYLQVIKEPLKDKNGKPHGIIAIINNVTSEELLRQELREKSITDQLTGVYNRVYFEELLVLNSINPQFPLTVVTADCDHLKQINDEFGHNAGDEYILLGRDLLRDNLPANTNLFRMGGDEFLAVLPGIDKKTAEVLLNRLENKINDYKTDEFNLEISIGSYTIESDGDSLENALIQSDKAMYKAKQNHHKE